MPCSTIAFRRFVTCFFEIQHKIIDSGEQFNISDNRVIPCIFGIMQAKRFSLNFEKQTHNNWWYGVHLEACGMFATVRTGQPHFQCLNIFYSKTWHHPQCSRGTANTPAPGSSESHPHQFSKRAPRNFTIP